ncbi:hypothetical protein Dd586_3374 [Dickeya parazeae Ech586]|uniref:Uncharacterized protein n=1 Tax=Dickeya zeae (strain Ech586) TaxID=590409 RepID=D2BVS3_DICZ5|nr:hypothetical protein Dd586_3374 [Dickeya parazeae Ech586]
MKKITITAGQRYRSPSTEKSNHADGARHVLRANALCDRSRGIIRCVSRHTLLQRGVQPVTQVVIGR